MVHGSWTYCAPGSTVGWSGAGAGAMAVHGRRTARHVRGLADGAGEGEQDRVRSGDGSPRRDRR
jgi:hypothetical protein